MASTNTLFLHYTALKRILLLIIFFPSLNVFGLSGIKTVGTGGDYTSLTGPGGAFQAINTLGLTADFTLKITTNLNNETGAFMLNQWTGTFSVYIVPNTATLKTITFNTGSATCTDLLSLNGADNVIIDGRFNGTGTDYLRFNSTCPTQSLINLIGDCQNVTIRNCLIYSDNSSSSTASGGAIRVEAPTSGGSDNLKILYNTIQDYTTTSGIINLCDGIQINAPSTAGVNMDNLEITGNKFSNINGRSIYLVNGLGTINGALINRNHFYLPFNATGGGAGVIYSAIMVESGNGHTIRANYIGGSAPFCAGSMYVLLAAGGSSNISLINIRNALPNVSTSTAVNNIDSNVIKNVWLEGNSTAIMSVSLINVERGNCNIGSTYSNYLGDNTVDARWTGNYSILVQEKFDASGNVFNGIYSTSTGTVNISNNRIGGILLPQQTNNGLTAAIICGSSSPTNFTNNVIGGVAYSIVKEGAGPIRIIFSDSSPSAFNMTGNSVFGMYAAVGFFDTFDVLRVIAGTGNGAPTITDNTLESAIMNTMSTLSMIRVANRNAVIERNIMRNVTTIVQTGLVFKGIEYLPTTGTTGSIRDNYISNIRATNSTGLNEASLVGINVGGPVVFTLESNYIERMATASPNNLSYIRGMQITSSTSNRLRNNVVLLDNMGLTNNITIYALYDNATSGAHNIYYNTLDVRGTMTGTRGSACYYRNGAATRSVMNNIFNNRRSGGTAGNYAVNYFNGGTGMTSNYNVYYVEENPVRMAGWAGVDCDKNAWLALASGFDANSVFPLTVQNIVDFTNGHQTTTVGNDRALNVSITDDHDDVPRPIGLGFDIGAFEIDNILLLSPLPVTISEIALNCEEDASTRIQWTSASEAQCDYYVVEKSTDGESWEKLSTTSGQGNSFLPMEYTAYDYDEHIQGMYYRVILVDVNGIPTYSTPEFINCNEPLCDQFNVHYNENSQLQIAMECEMHDVSFNIYSTGGQLIGQWSYPTEEKTVTESVQLMNGVYIIQLNANGKTFTRKVVI
jgi:hypothetical protein